jgi:hypothetical protein
MNVDDELNNVANKNNIEFESKTLQNFELFAEECKQTYKDYYENHLNENEMTTNFEKIRSILEAKFKDYMKNSNEECLKTQFENLLSELLNQSLNKTRSDSNEFVNYINKAKNDYIEKIMQHLNKDNLLSFEEIEKLHISTKETILESFDEFSRSYKSSESFKDLLIKNLNEEYEQIEFYQQVFVKMNNLIVLKFNDSKYFTSEFAQQLFNKVRNEFIKEMSSKNDKDFDEIFIKIFDERLAFFLKYNNEIIINEKEIAEENVSSLKALYSKKLSEGIENDLFRKFPILEEYNNALVDACIESLKAGIDLKDTSLKREFENGLRKMLSEEFEKIKDSFRNKIKAVTVEESSDLCKESTISEASKDSVPLTE